MVSKLSVLGIARKPLVFSNFLLKNSKKKHIITPQMLSKPQTTVLCLQGTLSVNTQSTSSLEFIHELNYYYVRLFKIYSSHIFTTLSFVDRKAELLAKGRVFL